MLEFWSNYDANSHNVISACTFNDNKDLTSLIYVSINASDAVTLIVIDSKFVHNEGIALNLRNQIIKFLNDKGHTVFDNNLAQSGASLFLDLNSKVIFTY